MFFKRSVLQSSGFEYFSVSNMSEAEELAAACPLGEDRLNKYLYSKPNKQTQLVAVLLMEQLSR